MRFGLVSRSLAALIALTLSACDAWAQERPLRIERNPIGVIFQDPIDARAVDRLEAELRPGDKLLIDSASGDRDAALRLGNIVVERNIHVTVNGNCFSVCALYVFLPARSKDIPKGTWVWFDVSPFAWNAVLQDRPDLFSQPEREEFSRHLQDYEALLAKAGVSKALLACADAALEPDFPGAKRELQIARSRVSRNLIIPSRFRSAVLSREVLATFGVGVEGDYWRPADVKARTTLATAYDTSLVWVDAPGQCAGAGRP